MTSKLVATGVLVTAAFGTLVSANASVGMFNSWLFDQMAVPSVTTRAALKAELREFQQSQRDAQAASALPAVNPLDTQQHRNTASTTKPADAADGNSGVNTVKTSQ